MSTTSTLADLFANNASLLYMPIVAFSTATSIITRSSTLGRNSLYTETNRFQYLDNDGGSKNAVSGTITAGVTYIARFRKSGGNIYMAVDSGAGYVESLPTVCGNTDNMTYTYSIGSGSSGFYGKIGGVLTANTGVPKPNLEALLRESVFARSLLKYDPINCKLGLGRY
jgi:hypothetical protein